MELSPFMSYNGSVCFFILYHYESNSILATPITGLDNVSIFNAYKQQIELLTSKCFKPKLNIMNNQATEHIKHFLPKTVASCNLLSRIATVSMRLNTQFRCSKMHWLQPKLWQTAIVPSNLRSTYTLDSRHTKLIACFANQPNKMVHETFNRPYDWNRYSLAPLGCKAHLQRWPYT